MEVIVRRNFFKVMLENCILDFEILGSIYYLGVAFKIMLHGNNCLLYSWIPVQHWIEDNALLLKTFQNLLVKFFLRNAIKDSTHKSSHLSQMRHVHLQFWINYSMIVLQKANVKNIGPIGQSKKFSFGLRR